MIPVALVVIGTCPNQILPIQVDIESVLTNPMSKKLTKAEKDAYAIVGRIGGKATFKKRGKKYMSSIGKKGAKKRWSADDKK